MKVLILLMVSLIFSLAAPGQDSTARKKIRYDSTIKVFPVHRGKYHDIVYAAADNTPLSKKDIQRKLMAYEPSAEEYTKHQSAKRATFLWGAMSIASIVTGGSFHHSGKEGTAQTFLCVGLGGLVMETVNAVRTHKHFNRAIAVYNDHYRQQ